MTAQKIINLLKRSLKSLKYKFNKNIRFEGKVIIDTRSQIIARFGKITLKDGVELRSDPVGYHAGMPFPTTILIDKANAIVEIGEKTRLNGAYVHAQKEIRIGKNCVIASGVNILDANGHELISGDRTWGRDTPEPIIIGDNVWIGLNSVILKGTIIGNNSVVGANSVVKGEFSKNSLIIGNPGKVVKILDIKESNE